MKKVTVSPSSKIYEVLSGSGLLAEAGSRIRSVRACSRASAVMVVSDSHVAPLYLEPLMQSLEDAGFRAESFVFPAGEASKNAGTLFEILQRMAERRLTRSDLVCALGGGVTGDLAGLAAALYMRGIGLVQLPTSLLAAVDSSVGGKTAVDLPAGKNLAGCIWQPELVLCDTDALSTLPKEEIANGRAEIIKYAFIRDPGLLDLYRCPERIADTIARCVEIKGEFVAADERDTGLRQMLNFGHTFGHAVEQRSRFTLPHGSAVAVGMVLVTRAAVRKGLCSEACLNRLLAELSACGLPASTIYPAEELLAAVRRDKKCEGDRINLIIPRSIGVCERLNLPLSEAEEWLITGIG